MKNTRETDISKAAAALGRKGGKAKTDAKTSAARANGVKGGRPRKPVAHIYHTRDIGWVADDEDGREITIGPTGYTDCLTAARIFARRAGYRPVRRAEMDRPA